MIKKKREKWVFYIKKYIFSSNICNICKIDIMYKIEFFSSINRLNRFSYSILSFYINIYMYINL